MQAMGNKSTRGWDDVRAVTVLQREKEKRMIIVTSPIPILFQLRSARRGAMRWRLAFLNCPCNAAPGIAITMD